MAKKIKKGNTFTYGQNTVKVNNNEELLVEHNYNNASLKARFYAFLIDCFLYLPLAYIMFVATNNLRAKGLAGDADALTSSNYLALSTVCLALVLFGFFPDRYDGQTIGKKILKIRVIDKSGNQLGIIRSFLREFVFRMIIGIMLLPGTLIYSLILTQQRKRFTLEFVHDYICGTRVVLK